MADVPSPDVHSDQTFAALGLPGELVAALDAQQITEPFPIQSATIPDSLAGHDLLGRGQTGSGKTLAFALPTLARLSAGTRPGRSPRAVILSPTRELAMQIADVIQPLARRMGLFSVLVAGGMKYGPQLKMLERGVDIIVATPGRMIDLIERGAADLSSVEVAVLDEADEMCDMGFFEEVTAIWDRIPAKAQHLLFSATLDDEVQQIAEKYLDDPVEHGVDPGKATVTTMEHRIWVVHPLDKFEIASMVANREGRTLVFVRTQMDAEKMGQYLRRHGLMAGALHGGMRQGARSRVMDAFRRGDLPVLVATDVAARGIDVNDVSLVLQADIAHDAKDYLHRAGRTARAGTDGQVISFVAPRQRRRMDQISRQVGLTSKNVRVRLGDETLADFEAPSGEPIADDSYEAVLWPPRPGRRGRSGRGSGRRGSREETRRARREINREADHGELRRARRPRSGDSRCDGMGPSIDPVIEQASVAPRRSSGKDLADELLEYDRSLRDPEARQRGSHHDRYAAVSRSRRWGDRRRNTNEQDRGRGKRSDSAERSGLRGRGLRDRRGWSADRETEWTPQERGRDRARQRKTRSYRPGGRERRYDDLGSDWRFRRRDDQGFEGRDRFDRDRGTKDRESRGSLRGGKASGGRERGKSAPPHTRGQEFGRRNRRA
ncbi:hypothetical protein HMPREF1531_01650 [Propionibacterium sp. oral taxon 192 str. F0372]|uniref:DEAD/DEAH box helicase n=1 Tax=Propionibacterium sp. oral taxon 192 TaxID=671222 RepID=UPI00035417E7|nr:DEAD/DEAH box helicase [Propionibacterium sp. oral taxon 192]EPH02344.1 hypothetical protein HMPREF1531_01650 [Propionibacterium sp. oral taxon 192 str. F0372]